MDCRICLRKSDNTMDIFSKENQHLMISNIIYKHLAFSPLPDNFTTVICTKCYLTIYNFHEFFEFVQRVQNQFNKIQQQEQEQRQQQEPENIIIYQSDAIPLNDKLLEINDILHEQMNIEIEKSECTEICSKTDENPLDEPLTSPTMTPTRAIFPMVCFSESSNDELKLLSKEINLNSRGINNNNRKATITTPSHKLSESEIDALINKYIPMTCDLCVFLGRSYFELKDHFIKDHPQDSPYVKCCNRKLMERYYLTKHALLHADPSLFKCIDCEKTFANNRGLRAHNLTYHDSGERKKSYACQGVIYKCTECDRECQSRVALSNHKRHKHSNKVHLCEICGKYFKKAVALKEHMTQHSGEALYKCAFCTRTFNAKSNMYAHKKRMHPFEWDKPKRSSVPTININCMYQPHTEKLEYTDCYTNSNMKK